MNLVPKPAKFENKNGSLRASTLRGVAISGWDNVPSSTQLLLAGLRRVYQRDVELTASGALTLRRADGYADEGYSIEVTPSAVTLEASTEAGVARAVSTFLQYIEGAPERLPAVLIEDAPSYRWRGMHLDVCRHFFDVGFVKKYIDLLFEHRLNVFHWHLTEDQGWRLEIDRYPELTSISAWRTEGDERYGGFYTKADVREVVAYARERQIQVIPEIELPGHSVATLAAYPELSCSGGPFAVETHWGIFDDVYCAGNDAVFEFFANVFDEVCELFPSEYVHIGGDECPKVRWEECPKCRARMKAEALSGGGELQSWFVSQASGLLAARGKRLIGWDEILEGGLVPDATVMSWRGTGGAVQAAREGHDVILSPTSHCYFDYQQSDSPVEPGAHGVIPLETVYEFNPTPAELTAQERKHVLGGQGNVWTERMTAARDVEYMSIPRVCALAESLWTPDAGRDWSDFRRRLDGHLPRLNRLGFNYRKPGSVGS